MAGFTIVGQQKLLEHAMGKTSLTMPTMYVALCTSAPTDSTGGTECSFTGYARKVTAAADWNAATSAVPSVMTNANALNFAACTAGSQTATHFELWDASTSGNRYAWGPLDASLAISAGITPQIPVAQLRASLD